MVLTVDSDPLWSKNVRFCSKNAWFCLKIFSRLMIEIARWSLEIFLCSKCLTISPLEIARIENFNARNARDRCFCRSVSTLKYIEKSYTCFEFRHVQRWEYHIFYDLKAEVPTQSCLPSPVSTFGEILVHIDTHAYISGPCIQEFFIHFCP